MDQPTRSFRAQLDEREAKPRVTPEHPARSGQTRIWPVRQFSPAKVEPQRLFDLGNNPPIWPKYSVPRQDPQADPDPRPRS